MRFDAALAAQETLREAEAEPVPTGTRPLNWKRHFPMPAPARGLRATLCAGRPPPHRASLPGLRIYITWQQVTEETIARHFQTGMTLAEATFALPEERPRT